MIFHLILLFWVGTYDLWGGFSGTISTLLSSVFMKYKAGAQYAELSSITSQLEQFESARPADCTVGLKATNKSQQSGNR